MPNAVSAPVDMWLPRQSALRVMTNLRADEWAAPESRALWVTSAVQHVLYSVFMCSRLHTYGTLA